MNDTITSSNDTINKLFIGFSKRAEKFDKHTLVETFVDVGPLLSVLSTIDNQILYGRRGTGKTHALVYLAETQKQKGDIAVYLDLRGIGSTGGIYSDQNILLAERATRLLMDTLAAIHDELMNIALDDSLSINLAIVGPILDELAASITEITVRGEVEQERAEEIAQTSEAGTDAKIELTPKSMKVATGLQSKETFKGSETLRVKTKGAPEHRVHFGRVGSILQRLCQALHNVRIWVILDEWSVIPIELQPYLADLLRRSLFPIAQITVKIGAIEKRSNFQRALTGGDYIGIELGGDASADLNMDDFMVFDNDGDRATAFYKALIFKHFRAIAESEEFSGAPSTPDELTRFAFTQENVFREFVRAAEGIPRDAFYILSLAAQRSLSDTISMQAIRMSSKTWYQRDKETAVAANPEALRLLHWIIDKVIAHRRARAFLLERTVSHELIDRLFDARVLHLLKRNISAHDQPGVRYDVYKIDYGCYVDLLYTARSPLGLLETDDGGHIDVPPDDYRAIRRAILNILEFENESD
ncbi:MAG: hypothetical protein HQK60_03510 [Deltaproteobacteria bacterium]|nr:hypothetical protein [Deltaproteobacteria bacterium]